MFAIESAAVVAEEVRVAVAAQAQAVGVLAAHRGPGRRRGPHPGAEPAAAPDQPPRTRCCGPSACRAGRCCSNRWGGRWSRSPSARWGRRSWRSSRQASFPSGFARRVEPDPGVRVDGLVHVVGALGLRGRPPRAGRGAAPRHRHGAAESDAPRAVDRLASWAPSPRAGIGVRFAFGRDGRTGSVAGAAGRGGRGGRPGGGRPHLRGEPRPADRRARPLRRALRPRDRSGRRGAARRGGRGARRQPGGGGARAVHGDHRPGRQRRAGPHRHGDPQGRPGARGARGPPAPGARRARPWGAERRATSTSTSATCSRCGARAARASCA